MFKASLFSLLLVAFTYGMPNPSPFQPQTSCLGGYIPGNDFHLYNETLQNLTGTFEQNLKNITELINLQGKIQKVLQETDKIMLYLADNFNKTKYIRSELDLECFQQVHKSLFDLGDQIKGLLHYWSIKQDEQQLPGIIIFIVILLIFSLVLLAIRFGTSKAFWV